jgi:hypothetical protein
MMRRTWSLITLPKVSVKDLHNGKVGAMFCKRVTTEGPRQEDELNERSVRLGEALVFCFSP